jgi:uncharacterized OsmC-like protein
MTDDNVRSVTLTRLHRGRYEATNAKGATLVLGAGQDDAFSPVELFLAAIAGCSAIDVDFITSRRAEATRFEVKMSGTPVRDKSGNQLADLRLSFDIGFPDDESGAAAREVLPLSVARSHDRLCTVSRTVEAGAPVNVEIVERPPGRPQGERTG